MHFGVLCDLPSAASAKTILYIGQWRRQTGALHLNRRACLMDWRTRFAGSRGNIAAGLLVERMAVFP